MVDVGRIDGAGLASEKLKARSIWIAATMFVSTLAVLLPFRNDLSVVFRFWDGPLYLYVAKTFYAVPGDHPFAAYNLPPLYFASHLPLYPLLIRIGSWVTLGNFPAAMLAVSVICSVVSAVLFFQLLERRKLVVSPFWTALVFCFLPPRWLLFHSVGASESLFLCLVLAAFLAYYAERPVLVILLVMLASVTRITGVLMIPAFGMMYLLRKKYLSASLMLMALLGPLLVFALYAYRFDDFWAYFRWNAGQHKIIDLHPFAIYRLYVTNINFHSTELYLWTYVVFGVGTLLLWRKKELFIFSAIFFAFHTLVFHADLSRYILVLAPFSILIALDPILSLKPVAWIAPLFLYLSYLYVWGWIPLNTCSVQAYQKLLQTLAQ